jgi:hypothetical protein
VNRIRDFSSGILKQLAKVLAMAANMGDSAKLYLGCDFDRAGFSAAGLAAAGAG